LRSAAWPPLVQQLLEATDEPRPLREVLAAMTRDGTSSASDVLRALEILLVARVLAWQ
jgi:hypothetical protein